MMKKLYFAWIGFLKKFLLLAVRFYQKAISPHFMPCCRFTPTCSQYAYEAISRFGIVKGTYLAVRRLLKCHPFSKKGGYDPVPQSFGTKISNVCVKEDKKC